MLARLLERRWNRGGGDEVKSESLDGGGGEILCGRSDGDRESASAISDGDLALS